MKIALKHACVKRVIVVTLKLNPKRQHGVFENEF